MRIFYASDTTPNGFLQSNLWRSNLYLSLVDLGHEVIEFDYDLGETFKHLDPTNPNHQAFIKVNRPKVSRELLLQLKAAHLVEPIDMLFTYFYDACILPETLDEIRTMGIITVNWYCNGSYQLHLVSQIAPHYDWCLVPEKFRLPDYRAMGANPIYCQEAANPNIYKPYALPIKYDVAFVGQAYGERPNYIKYLLDQEIDVHVWGFNWNKYSSDKTEHPRLSAATRLGYIGRNLTTRAGRQIVWERAKRRLNLQKGGQWSNEKIELPVSSIGGVLSDEDMIKLYSQTKINLGFSTCGDTHLGEQRILQVRLRDFEVPMSGGFYMVEYMEELEEFYNIGREVVCYHNPEDLAEKIKYYLTHDSEREHIRQAGYQRCLTDHTWQKRLDSAFQQMKLDLVK